MGNRENKIIAFVGLAGTGKTTATEYIADKGFPRVVVDSDIKSIIEQIHGLDGAGQHNIIVDGLGKWSDFKTLKHKFPGEVVTIAVISNKRLRHRRLANNPKLSLNAEEADERDWSDIEKFNISGPIAVADYYIINNSGLDKFQDQIDDVLAEVGFYQD